ncbi:unnamed protein product, partial [Closterium sp. NIES-54]
MSTTSEWALDVLLRGESEEFWGASKVVLEEVKSRKVAVYGRLRALVAEESRRFFVFSNEHHKALVAEGGVTPLLRLLQREHH